MKGGGKKQLEEYPETEDNQNENRNGQVLEKLTPDQLKTFDQYVELYNQSLKKFRKHNEDFFSTIDWNLINFYSKVLINKRDIKLKEKDKILSFLRKCC